jgi:hypothetical protein
MQQMHTVSDETLCSAVGVVVKVYVCAVVWTCLASTLSIIGCARQSVLLVPPCGAPAAGLCGQELQGHQHQGEACVRALMLQQHVLLKATQLLSVAACDQNNSLRSRGGHACALVLNLVQSIGLDVCCCCCNLPCILRPTMLWLGCCCCCCCCTRYCRMMAAR